ncbi:MAG: PQ-loop domain-containing transporter [Propionicimonas sp.]
MDPVIVIGWAAALTATLLGLPQAVRLLRTRHVDGISLLSWQCLFVINIAWASHGVLIEKLNMILPNLLAMSCTLPVLFLIAKGRGLRLSRVLLPPIGFAVLMIAVDVLFGTAAFGVVGILPAIMSNAGQSVDLVRSPTIDGVSGLFLVLTVLNQSLWLTWALLVFEVGSMVTATVTGVVAVFNLVWWVLRRAGLPALFVAEPEASARAAGAGVA